MTVKELIDLLNKQPQNAEVFYGSFWDYGLKDPENIPTVELYTVEPMFYEKVKSCRSSLPSSYNIKENIVVLETC